MNALVFSLVIALAPEAWTETQLRRAAMPRARVRAYKRSFGRYFGWRYPCAAVPS